MAIINYQIIELIIPAVSGVVFPQCSHHDHADKTNKEDDHHERIEDGEPVNLHGRTYGDRGEEKVCTYIHCYSACTCTVASFFCR